MGQENCKLASCCSENKPGGGAAAGSESKLRSTRQLEVREVSPGGGTGPSEDSSPRLCLTEHAFTYCTPSEHTSLSSASFVTAIRLVTASKSRGGGEEEVNKKSPEASIRMLLLLLGQIFLCFLIQMMAAVCALLAGRVRNDCLGPLQRPRCSCRRRSLRERSLIMRSFQSEHRLLLFTAVHTCTVGTCVGRKKNPSTAHCHV